MIEKFTIAALALIGAFLVYVSMTDKKYKGKQLTLWQKIKLFFHKCPCGDTLEAWSWGVYKCRKCGETYYI